MWIFFQVVLLIFLIPLVMGVGYLLILTLAARKAQKGTPVTSSEPRHHFLILVPAHNEEALLPSLLENLKHMDYPNSKYGIHVVADNCTDGTVQAAQNGGATVHERVDLEKKGKGHALTWLLECLRRQDMEVDALVILDADSIVSKNFLSAMDEYLNQGAKVIQAYYSVRDPEQSWNSSLRFAALAVLHYLRPQGRMVLGGSAGLKGNGMVFTDEVMKQHQWSSAITEDIEFHMSLILAGERVVFAPDAVVWAEMPGNLSGSKTQHDRWEQGRLEMARKYVPQLVRTALLDLKQKKYQRCYLLMDAVMEHLIPPFSIMTGLTALFSIATLISITIKLLWSSIGPGEIILAGVNTFGSIFLIFGQTIYIVSGLKMVQAPPKIYTAFIFAPVLVLWKIFRYIRVLLQRDQSEWVRTSRNRG